MGKKDHRVNKSSKYEERGVRNEKTCHGKSMKKERDQNKGSKKQNGKPQNDRKNEDMNDNERKREIGNQKKKGGKSKKGTEETMRHHG